MFCYFLLFPLLRCKQIDYSSEISAMENRVQKFILLLSLFALPIFASETCTQEGPSCQKVGSWRVSLALGYGAIDNPLRKKNNFPLLVVPNVSFYGEKWFIENTRLGFTFLDRKDVDLSLVVVPNQTSTYFYRYHPNNIVFGVDGTPSSDKDDEQGQAHRLSHVAKRKLAVDAGVLGHWYVTDSLKITASWFHDISNVYQGSHGDLGFSYQLPFHISDNDVLSLGAAIDYSSSALNNYYFGIGARDTDVVMEHYDAGSGLAYTLGLGYAKPINRHWSVKAKLKYKKLENAIVDSPLVNQSSTLDYFISMAYVF